MAVKTILLKPDLGSISGRGEKEAVTAITPGHILEFDVANANKVRPLQTAALNHPFIVAIENSLFGEDIDTAYSIADMVQYAVLQSGHEAYCWLSDGESVVVGDQLEYGTTDGELVKRSSGISVATALETVDLSASANTAKGRLQVMVN